MVENYTKDIKESVYHGAVISAPAVGYTMLGKTLIKMSSPSLGKFDVEDGDLGWIAWVFGLDNVGLFTSNR